MIIGTVMLAVAYLAISAAGAFFYNNRLALALVLLATGASYLCQGVGVLADENPALVLLSWWLWCLAVGLSVLGGAVVVLQ